MRSGETERRGQLVLVAAGVVAIALVPMVAAYLQLGYHADVDASAEYRQPVSNAERVLERAVHNATVSVRGDYDWSQRTLAADGVNRTLDPYRTRVEQSRLDTGVVYEVTQNGSAAGRWAVQHCPSGPNREFGDCEAVGGVVVQERAGETHALAVVYDVRVTTEDGTTDVTFVFRGVGGR
ncbi:hypothetical protein SAMN04487950_1851 [Halogranum rubrum]|uniref:Uncharacterized protein n=1 Tax=Halogranum rubrum TaxID=553466 RepID=A0A1I4E4W0_9EURY|nr:hypothetical protein [Halogranum rubrum]SFK99990.1 hypothetical protein SAMN04487950_1851 [Halogranum rubrum]